MITLEAVPTSWNDLHDGAFFRIVAHLLDARVAEAFSSLLAANDADTDTD